MKQYFNDNIITNFRNMQNSENKHLKHPILYLMDNPPQDVAYNTKNAFFTLYNNDKNYLDVMKKKIENEKNFSNINGYLGEIRCYGYLLNAFNNNFYIESIKTQKNIQTSDFKVVNKKNHEEIYIEVNTKQCNDAESKKFKKDREDIENKMNNISKNISNAKEPILKVYTASIAPFGSGKTGLETNMNVIQKIAQTKKGKSQIPNNRCGILWLDLQSEDINDLLTIRHSQPLWYQRNEGMFSGLIWYGLYGKKELPIFHSTQLHTSYGKMGKLYPMQHDGLFLQRKDISAVIISSGKYTLYFENIFCNKKIPLWFLQEIINIPKFSYENSVISLPPFNINENIEQTYKKIEDLSKFPNSNF